MFFIGDDVPDRRVIRNEPAGSIIPEGSVLLLQAAIVGQRLVPPPGPRRQIGNVPLTVFQSGTLAHPCGTRCSSHRTSSFLSTTHSTSRMRSMHGALCGPLCLANMGSSSALEQRAHWCAR